MSYDIMIIDRHPRFKDSKEFLEWFDDVTQWKENIDYDDCEQATPHLKEWFMKMKDIVRPMNGKYALSDEEIDRCLDADYAIAREGIMMAMGYPRLIKYVRLHLSLLRNTTFPILILAALTNSIILTEVVYSCFHSKKIMKFRMRMSCKQNAKRS